MTGRRLVPFAAAALFAMAPAAAADYLVLSRTAYVRAEPDGTSESYHHLQTGTVLLLLEDSQTNGYYHVEPQAGGRAGWVYRTMGRRNAGDPEPIQPTIPPSSPGPAGGGSTGAGGAGTEDASAFAIPNCQPEGNVSPKYSRYEELQALNRLKNRTLGPTGSQVVQISIEALMAPGPDEQRWSSTQAVRTVAWVAAVDSGGKETCNCKTPERQYWDTHIELKRGPNDTSEPMIVEVTPEWRGLRAVQGVDWTTPGLRQRFLHQYVAVTGWLTFDSQHWQNATNTNQDGDDVWRQTAWEIHPVTGIDLALGP